MTDIFSALANPNARLVLETLAKKPGLTATKLAEATKLTTPQISNLLTVVSEAKLVFERQGILTVSNLAS
jgi:DNA-binding transcriptional ArsR family regulator